MTSAPLTDLPLFARPASLVADPATNKNVEWFVGWLAGRDWTTANLVCAELGLAPTENNKRLIRRLADASNGRVIGHQRGYKLVRDMTKEEFQWWENETLKSKRALEAKVISARGVFYG
jgi:hypothetical protein